MSEKYFFVRRGKREGPVTLAELRELALKGELRRSDKAWRNSMETWESAGSISGLFDDLPPDLEEESPLLRTPVSPPQQQGNPELKPEPREQVRPEMVLSSIRRKLTPSAQRKLIIIGVGLILVTIALLWPSPDNQDPIRSWNMSRKPMPPSGSQPSTDYGLGQTHELRDAALEAKWDAEEAKYNAEIGEAVACEENLKKIGSALKLWASQHAGRFPFETSTNVGGTMELCRPGADGFDRNSFMHFRVLGGLLDSPKSLVCPSDRTTPPASNLSEVERSNTTYVIRVSYDQNPPSGDDELLLCRSHNKVMMRRHGLPTPPSLASLHALGQTQLITLLSAVGQRIETLKLSKQEWQSANQVQFTNEPIFKPFTGAFLTRDTDGRVKALILTLQCEGRPPRDLDPYFLAESFLEERFGPSDKVDLNVNLMAKHEAEWNLPRKAVFMERIPNGEGQRERIEYKLTVIAKEDDVIPKPIASAFGYALGLPMPMDLVRSGQPQKPGGVIVGVKALKPHPLLSGYALGLVPSTGRIYSITGLTNSDANRATDAFQKLMTEARSSYDWGTCTYEKGTDKVELRLENGDRAIVIGFNARAAGGGCVTSIRFVDGEVMDEAIKEAGSGGL